MVIGDQRIGGCPSNKWALEKRPMDMLLSETGCAGFDLLTKKPSTQSHTR